MEPPECPVCLQPFSAETTIPRVLSCGHSTCELCLSSLSSLPSPFPDSIRCPSCTQLVRLPRSLGPSSLPKNIDLLRLLRTPDTPPPPYKSPLPLPIPLPSHHPLLPDWSPFILPPSSILLNPSTGAATSSDGRSLRVYPLTAPPPAIDSEFRFSYSDRVARELDRISESDRDVLRVILRCSRRGVSKALGLWMSEDCVLHLVVEGHAMALRDAVVCGGKVVGLGMVGMEMCEAVMGLNDDGIVCGCLGLECFGLDEWGHCLIDLGRVLNEGMEVRNAIASGGDNCMTGPVYVSPEAVKYLTAGKRCSNVFGCDVGFSSDVWSLAGVLTMVTALSYGCRCDDEERVVPFVYQGSFWMEKMVSAIEASSVSTRFGSFVRVMELCLTCDPGSRPSVRELWKCLRELLFQPKNDPLACFHLRMPAAKETSACCLLLCGISSNIEVVRNSHKGNEEDLSGVLSQNLGNNPDVSGQLERNGPDLEPMEKDKIIGDAMKGQRDVSTDKGVGGNASDRPHDGGLKSVTLSGHRDCITGLATGGDFLFSSSFDKTVQVWSLKNFSHLWTLRGHEHRVMAILTVEAEGEQVLCASADSGGFIFVWAIGCSTGHALLSQWREHNDWRYSGVHSLAALGSQYLYTGSGDKSIKAWSMQDYSLSCIMTGHTSTVSSLVVSQGILYSGSWDGTVRLWWLDDHSPLTILGNDSPGKGYSVLSLAVDGEIIIASYENGHIKIWRNDALVCTQQNHNGAIFALQINGKQFLSAGWDKIIKVHELLKNELQVELMDVGNIDCNSVVTCLLSSQGKLFAGLSNKDIKVYHYSSNYIY